MVYNRGMKFVELTEAEFEKRHLMGENFLQSVEMYRRYKAMGREAYLVGVKDDMGEIVAKGLISGRNWRLGKKLFRVPGGWLMDYDGKNWGEVLEFLTKKTLTFCREKGGIVIEIAPNVTSQPRDGKNQVISGKNYLDVKAKLVELGYKYLGEYEQPKWEYYLEIEGKTPEELFKDFRNGHKWEIRRAERDGVRVRELGLDELTILKKITAESGERHGFHEPEVEYYRSMKKFFGEKVKFVVAEIPAEKLKADGIEVEKGLEYVPLAASMFLNDGREMIYLYSGSVRALQRYGGAHLIQWKMMQEAIKSGCKVYNFYGTRPVEGNGVYRFKQGFRGHVEELLGTFALPVGWLGRIYVGRLKTREFSEIE